MTEHRDLLDHPMMKYLVMGIFSIAAAYIFWQIGGSFAKLVGDDKSLGLSIELGGAIAGFVSVFWISLRAIERLHTLTPQKSSLLQIKVFLEPREEFAVEDDYQCKVSIYNDQTGDESVHDVMTRCENGYLTIDIRELSDADMFQIKVSNKSNQRWHSEYYHPLAPKVEMRLDDSKT